MAVILTSIKRLLTVFATLIGIAIVIILLFDVLVSEPINGSMLSSQILRIAVAIVFWAAIFLFVRRTRSLMSKHIGEQSTTILQLLMITIATLIAIFDILSALGTSAENLLTGAGFASITVGLIISTFVGSILAGALVFTTHKLRVGDTIVVNNVPGSVIEFTPIATRVRTDTGIITIPNSAISSGAIVITKLTKFEAATPIRLPYAIGDRIITTYMQAEGVVKQITALRTVIQLDNGREITFLNSSILSGSVAVAKITNTSA